MTSPLTIQLNSTLSPCSFEIIRPDGERRGFVETTCSLFGIDFGPSIMVAVWAHIPALSELSGTIFSESTMSFSVAIRAICTAWSSNSSSCCMALVIVVDETGLGLRWYV